jgi:hypothetical protein
MVLPWSTAPGAGGGSLPDALRIEVREVMSAREDPR